MWAAIHGGDIDLRRARVMANGTDHLDETTDCDLDHRQPWAQNGPTTPLNLAPLCRHDHRIKISPEWTLERLPTGDHQWTSPLSHEYTTTGEPP